MRRALTDVLLLTPDRARVRLEAGASGSLMGAIVSARTRRVLMQLDEVDVVFVGGVESVVRELIRPRDILRFEYDDGTAVEYRMLAPVRDFAGEDSVFKGLHLWHDLAHSVVTRTYATGESLAGKVDLTWSIVGRTPLEALQEIMASAPPYLAPGDDALSQEQAAKRVFLTFDGDTHLQALDYLCREVGCEWEVAYDVTADLYRVSLVGQAGRAGNRIVGWLDDGGINRLGLRRVRSAEGYASRIYPILADQEDDINVGQAVWRVVASEGSTLQLQGRPVPYSGFAVGRFFGSDEAGFAEIVATTAPDQVRLAAPFAGAAGRFALDAQGTWMAFLETPGAVHGDAERVERYQGAARENLAAEQGVAATMETWAGSLPVGYALVGTPAVQQSADAQYVRTGNYAALVTAAKGAGIETAPIEVPGPYLSVWASLGLVQGALALEIVDADEVSHPVGRERATTNARELVALTVEGVDAFASPVRVRVTATADGTQFAWDAVTLVASAHAYPWQPIMGPRALWERAGELVAREGAGVFDEIQGEMIDAAHLGIEYDEAEIGARIRVREGQDEDGSYSLDIETRIVELAYDLVADTYRKEVRLERRRSDLVDLLTEEENKRRHLPVPRALPVAKPVLVVGREELSDAVRLTFRCEDAREGRRLASYTLYLDWTYDAGSATWTRNPGAAFTPWRSETDTYPHAALFGRPPRDAYEVRAYVQDDTTGLRSDIAILTVPAALFHAWLLPGQDASGTASLEIHVDDPLLVVTAVAVSAKTATADTYSAWADEPAAPGPGEAGAIGADPEILRLWTQALHSKHALHARVRITWRRPDGVLDDYYLAASWDINRAPQVTWGVASVTEAGQVQGRAGVDEDTLSVAWAYSLVSAAAIDDAAFQAAIAAGQWAAVGPTRQVAAILYSGLAAGARIFVKYRPFRVATPVLATADRGPDYECEGVRQTADTVIPHVRVEKWQEAGYGFLQLEVYDPLGLVEQVRVRKAVGRDLAGDEPWVVLTNLGGYYETSVALAEKHASWIAYEVVLEGGITPLADAVPFDFLQVPNVLEAELDWDEQTLALRARGRVDEDAQAAAWALHASDPAQITAAVFQAAIAAGQFVNLVATDRFDVQVAAGVAPGAKRHVMLRPFAAPLTTASSATAGAGPDVLRTLQAPPEGTVLPYLTNVGQTQVGSTGYLTFDVEDPGALLAAVQMRKASGRHLLGSDAWQTITPASGSTYQVTVALVEGRLSFVQVRLNLLGGFDPVTFSPVAYDADTVPQAMFSYELLWSATLERYELYVSWQGDEDTASVRIWLLQPSASTITQNARIGRTLVANTIEPGATVQLEARGYAGTGASGTQSAQPWQVTFAAPTAAPGVDADRIFGLIQADQVVGAARSWASSVAFSSPAYNVLSWSSGTIDVGGTSYGVAASSATLTSTTAPRYFFFDPDSPGLGIQHTTSFQAAVLGKRFVLCVALRSTDANGTAVYIPAIGAAGGVRPVSTDELSANVLRAVKAVVGNLQALSIYTGDLTVTGTLTAGYTRISAARGIDVEVGTAFDPDPTRAYTLSYGGTTVFRLTGYVPTPGVGVIEARDYSSFAFTAGLTVTGQLVAGDVVPDTVTLVEQPIDPFFPGSTFGRLYQRAGYLRWRHGTGSQRSLLHYDATKLVMPSTYAVDIQGGAWSGYGVPIDIGLGQTLYLPLFYI